MTELQAALGVSQMTRLVEFVAARHLLADRYNNELKALPLTLPYQLPDTYSGLHLYVVRLKLGCIDMTHKQVFDELRANGIGVNLHYIPVFRQPYFRDMGFDPLDFPEAEKYYQEAISLPMFHSMTIEQQDEVIHILKRLI
jgi:dTDP-4-amino-4,6-dideoxygalactose transaminase